MKKIFILSAVLILISLLVMIGIASAACPDGYCDTTERMYGSCSKDCPINCNLYPYAPGCGALPPDPCKSPDPTIAEPYTTCVRNCRAKCKEAIIKGKILPSTYQLTGIEDYCFDTSKYPIEKVPECHGILCGNRKAETPYEQCDGPDLNLKSCKDFKINYGFYSKIFVGGELSCNSDCIFNTIKCHTCGDGVLDLSEQCDGNDFFPLPYTDEDGNRVDARDCVSYNYLNNERDRYGYYFLSRIDEFVSGTVDCYPQGHEKQCQLDFSNCVLAPACCMYKLWIPPNIDTGLFQYKKSANGRCDMEGDKISSDSCELFANVNTPTGPQNLIYASCYHESDCPDDYGPLSPPTITGNTILGRIILNLKESIRFIGNAIKDIFS